MPIEKAFAIRAAPDAIYDALDGELREAASDDDGAFEVLERDPGRRMALRVSIGGVPCRLTYVITPRLVDTEVSATLEPSGWRYALFRFITLGMNQQGFELALVQGLANLKAALEDEPEEDAADTGDA
jgi:hypothetical protein